MPSTPCNDYELINEHNIEKHKKKSQLILKIENNKKITGMSK